MLRTRNAGILNDAFDLERVEILRGPQGALFGRNNLAGTISMVSARPTEDSGGKVKLTLGENGLRTVRAAGGLARRLRVSQPWSRSSSFHSPASSLASDSCRNTPSAKLRADSSCFHSSAISCLICTTRWYAHLAAKRIA